MRSSIFKASGQKVPIKAAHQKNSFQFSSKMKELKKEIKHFIMDRIVNKEYYAQEHRKYWNAQVSAFPFEMHQKAASQMVKDTTEHAL